MNIILGFFNSKLFLDLINHPKNIDLIYSLVIELLEFMYFEEIAGKGKKRLKYEFSKMSVYKYTICYV